jgi:hypothetical protein
MSSGRRSQLSGCCSKNLNSRVLVRPDYLISANLLHYATATREVDSRLRQLAALMARRAKNVYENLVNLRLVLCVPSNSLVSNDEWQETGCYYGKAPCRVRPHYEGRDVEKSVNMTEEGSYRKLYSTYGKRSLTGGLMALWCPHLVCLGFHKMPKSEGRNDVFSALYKYWETLPKVVIHDFAC